MKNSEIDKMFDGLAPSSAGPITGGFTPGAESVTAYLARARPASRGADGAPGRLDDAPDAGVPFPVDALPSALRAFVLAEAEYTQTPIDLPALLVLGCCAASVAGKVEIDVGYREPLNLFAVVALKPGERKSAVFKDCFAPLHDAERRQVEGSALSISNARTQHDLLEATIKRTKAELAKLSPHEQGQEWKANQTGTAGGGLALRRQIADMEARLRRMDVPAEPQLIADDVTMERLAGLLAEQGGRMCIASAEGTIFGIISGRYSRNGQASFEVLLKGHAGDMLKVDRQSKDRPSIHLERPCLTLVLAVQPSIIQGLSADSAMRGQGLLARFLYSLPTSRVGTRKIAVEPVPDAVRAAYHAVVTMLADTPTPLPETTIPALALSPGALRLHRDFCAEVEPRLAGDLASIADWANKWPGAVARIAGVLHCAEHGATGEISADTVKSAIAIGRYLLAHALKAFGVMSTTPAELDAMAVLAWARRARVDTFTLRSLARHMSPREVARDKRRREAAVEVLEYLGAAVQAGGGYKIVAPGSS